MTYIVNDKCINCRHTDCVEVCPVDCFYLGENTIVIHPDECRLYFMNSVMPYMDYFRMWNTLIYQEQVSQGIMSSFHLN